MRVATLVGGRSGEYDVSLVTGQAVRGALDRLGHEAFELKLEQDGSASWSTGHGTLAAGLTALSRWAPDVAFIAMHGAHGEDGTVQGLLELMGIPYQGSDVSSSALAMHKARSKMVFRDAGLPVAADRTIVHGNPEVDWDEVASELGLPLVLKTSQSGSSVGVEVVETREDLATLGADLLAQTDALVVEEWLPGRELTCAVLEEGDGSPRTLPLVEIRPHSARFFDYDTKYDPNAVDEICPAPVDDELAREVERLSLAAHRVLGCRDYSRSDFKLDAEGRPILLETNTLPGLTPASLMPKSAKAADMSFDGLIDHLLRLARRRRV